MERRNPKICGGRLHPKSVPNSRMKNKKKSTNIPPKIESVMFCAFTPFSELRSRLQIEEDRINGQRATCRVKVIERSGPKIGDLLNNKTPWMKNHCGRAECAPCKTKPGYCKIPSITYRIECQKCEEDGVRSVYIGESCRTYFDRASDHTKALKNQDSSY